jgi:hypothetical protein
VRNKLVVIMQLLIFLISFNVVIDAIISPSVLCAEEQAPSSSAGHKNKYTYQNQKIIGISPVGVVMILGTLV